MLYFCSKTKDLSSQEMVFKKPIEKFGQRINISYVVKDDYSVDVT